MCVCVRGHANFLIRRKTGEREFSGDVSARIVGRYTRG